MHYACLLSSFPHKLGLGSVAGQWLFADNMLSSLGSGYTWLSMQVIGCTIVKYLDIGIIHQFMPVGDSFFIAKALCSGLHALLVPTSYGHQACVRRRRGINIIEFFIGICMGFPHKSITKHTYTQRRYLARYFLYIAHVDKSYALGIRHEALLLSI